MPLAAAAWVKGVVAGDELNTLRQVFPCWGHGDDPVVTGCYIADCLAAVLVGLVFIPILILGWSWPTDSNAVLLLVLRSLFLTGTYSKPVEWSCEKDCFEAMIFAWKSSSFRFWSFLKLEMIQESHTSEISLLECLL